MFCRFVLVLALWLLPRIALACPSCVVDSPRERPLLLLLVAAPVFLCALTIGWFGWAGRGRGAE